MENTIKSSYQQPTRELLDSVKPDDLVWINSWHKPFQVKCVSPNYFVMTGSDDGEHMYSIVSKRPFSGESCNGVSAGDFYCGPGTWLFGCDLIYKYKDVYSFTNKSANRKYMKSLEDGRTRILVRKMAKINQIRILRMSCAKKDPVQFVEECFGAKLLPYQKALLRLQWNINKR